MPRKSHQGFTLVELVLAILIIGITLAGSLIGFIATARKNADPLILQQANYLAQSYMEEILTKDFPSILPCPAPIGGGRPNYTNVCDYQNLYDLVASNQYGQPISGLNRYSVKVQIDTSAASLDSLTAGTQVVRIDVTVLNSQLNNLVHSAFKTAY